MFASKYYKYIGVASGCVGLGAALKYVYGEDGVSSPRVIYSEFNRNAVSTVAAEAEKPAVNYAVNYDFSAAINDSRQELFKMKEISGAPGVCIAVNVDGKNVWSEGLGVADIENDVPCTPQTVMRIASISKSITMAVLARLWQEGLVDLDKPVQEYVPTFPVLSFEGENADITTRMLVSHLSGIRHYKKRKLNKISENIEDATDSKMLEQNSGDNVNPDKKSADGKQDKKSDDDGKLDKKTLDTKKRIKDTEFAEMYLPFRINSVEEALNIFKNDELFHKPGSKYHYTTYGYTLISAVIETAAQSTFPKIMAEFFDQMGLHSTSLDYNESIIYHRARFYSRDKRSGCLQNSRIVDNSYKWAGGGFLSNVEDLTKFADIMLYCFQQREGDFPGYLSKKTVEELWTVRTDTPGSLRGSGYGMGWAVVPSRHEYGWGDKQALVVSHTGGAVGASSVLLVLPRHTSSKDGPPKGVTVAILANVDNINFESTANYIAKRFERDLSSWL